MALSPAMVFYSRIHPGGAVRLLRARLRDRRRTRRHRWGLAWAAMTGVAAGLAMATKETAAIVLPSASRPPRLRGGRSEPRPAERADRQPLAEGDPGGPGRRSGSRGAFYSSFLTAPGAMVEPFRGAGTYLDPRDRPAGHAQPWHYYLRLLTHSASGGLRWSEGLVLALAALGAITAWRRSDGSPPGSRFWPRTSPATSSLRARSFRRFPTRRPGTCCRSMPAPSRSPASGSRRS